MTKICTVFLALALGSAACGSAVLQRKVKFPTEPTVVVGPNRLRTVAISAVHFVPKPSTGTGEEKWPADAVAAVESRLRTDLAAQKWLGVQAAENAELSLELSCDYQAQLQRQSPWLWTPTVAGLAVAGVGGALFANKDARVTASTCVIVGVVVAMLGGFAIAKAVGPPSVRVDALGCISEVKDPLGRTLSRSEHHSRLENAGGFSVFLAEGEKAMFTEMRDRIDTAIDAARASQEGTGTLGSMAILDFEAPMLDERQRAMMAKLAASELQTLHLGRVIGVDDVRAILGLDRLKSLVGCNEESCITELGGALGVDRVVAGSISQVGASVVVELRLLHVQSVSVERRASMDLRSIDQVVAQVPALVRQLMRR